MKCSFCSRTISPGTGKIFVRKDGSMLNFCSTKCGKSMLKLNRKPYATAWTDSYHQEKKSGKQLKKETKAESKTETKTAAKADAKKVNHDTKDTRAPEA